MAQALSSEDAKELLRFTRAGMLYEIAAWITAGRSLQVPTDIKKTPLQIAVERGFHSLVRLLATHEDSQTVKNDAMGDAADLRRRDLVELLLEPRAQAIGIPLLRVLRSWEPSLIRLFLGRGADVRTGHPFAMAFGEKIRTAIRPFTEYRATHPELSDILQEQMDRALRYFCDQQDLKWVSLLIWTGSRITCTSWR